MKPVSGKRGSTQALQSGALLVVVQVDVLLGGQVSGPRRSSAAASSGSGVTQDLCHRPTPTAVPPVMPLPREGQNQRRCRQAQHRQKLRRPHGGLVQAQQHGAQPAQHSTAQARAQARDRGAVSMLWRGGVPLSADTGPHRIIMAHTRGWKGWCTAPLDGVRQPGALCVALAAPGRAPHRRGPQLQRGMWRWAAAHFARPASTPQARAASSLQRQPRAAKQQHISGKQCKDRAWRAIGKSL